MGELEVTEVPTIRARPRRVATESDEPAAAFVPPYVRHLAWVLDEAIPLFGSRRVGVDGILSFIPGFGDATGFGLSAVVVLAGVRAGCSWPTIARMVLHAAGESLFGLVPVLGPVVAFAWKANTRNLAIIQRDLQDREATRRESWTVLLVALAMFVLLCGILVLGVAVAIYAFWEWLS